MEHKNYQQKKEQWELWHNKNPQVWEYFEKFALESVKKGHKKISHWLLINRVRWETSINTSGNDFKISNNFIAFYARLWNEKYPEYNKLFTLKKMEGEDGRMDTNDL